MCKRAAFLTLAVAALSSPLVGGSLTAQSATEVRAELQATRDSGAAARAELDRLRELVTLNPDTVLVEQGVRVHYPREQFDAAAQAAMRRAIRGAIGRLERRFGSAGTALMDNEEWTLRLVTRGPNDRMIDIRFQPGDQGLNLMRLPLAAGAVADRIYRQMSLRAAALHPAVDRFALGAPVLDVYKRQYRVALQQLARSSSTPARRCAQGVLTACQIVLGPVESLLFDESSTEYRRAFTSAVAGSVVAFALDLGGSAVLDSLARGGTADENAVAVIAATIGLTESELVARWNARLRETSAERAAPSLPLAATTVLWCSLFLVIVGRRRPQ